MAGGTRRGSGGAPEGRVEGVHASGARALVDDHANARRAAASPRTGAAPLRDSTALGSAVGAARLPCAGLARASRLATRSCTVAGLAHLRLLRWVATNT